MATVNVPNACMVLTSVEATCREAREALVAGINMQSASKQLVMGPGEQTPPPAALQAEANNVLGHGLSLIANAGQQLVRLHNEIHGKTTPEIAGRIGEQLNGKPHA